MANMKMAMCKRPRTRARQHNEPAVPGKNVIQICAQQVQSGSRRSWWAATEQWVRLTREEDEIVATELAARRLDIGSVVWILRVIVLPAAVQRDPSRVDVG
eukprot:SAG31_NODE_33845_length_339_cov_0.933333_1_plen_100_part_10